MKPAARVLAFPVAVAVVTALSGCHGIDINDPLVRECRSTDTLVDTLPSGLIVTTHFPPEDSTRCRKAA